MARVQKTAAILEIAPSAAGQGTACSIAIDRVSRLTVARPQNQRTIDRLWAI
jgi:hypothetical protein